MPYRTVTSGLIVDKTITTADIADDAVTAAKIAACAIEDANIKRGTITGAALHDDAVSLAKLAPGSAGCYIGFDGEGNPAELSGGGGGGDGCFECVCGTCCIESPYGYFGATLIAPAWAGGSAEGSIATDGSGNLCYYSGGAWHQANAEDSGSQECVCGTVCVASPIGCLDCVFACVCVEGPVGCFGSTLIVPAYPGGSAEGSIATDGSGNLCYYSSGEWHQANAEGGGGCYECVCGTTCVASPVGCLDCVFAYSCVESPFGCLDCVCACSCVVSGVGCFCDQLIAPSWAGDGAEGAIATDSSGNLCYYSGGAWHQVCVV